MGTLDASFGPLRLLAIAVILLLDILLPVMSRGEMRESLLIGLSFGQTGAVVVWAFAAAAVTWRRIAACYVTAVIMSLYFMFCESPSADSGDAAMLITIWCGYVTMAVALIFGARWLRHQWSRQTAIESEEQPPRFGVRHLLMVMTLLAVASLIVRFAMPELKSANHATIVLQIAQSALLALLVVELMRQELSLFMQLGGLAVAGLVGSFIMTIAIEWDKSSYANAMQLSVLALTMLVFHFDRFVIRVHFEPRDGDP